MYLASYLGIADAIEEQAVPAKVGMLSDRSGYYAEQR